MNNFENTFMPITKEDLIKRNIEQLDFVFVSGDAYVDHPSFAVAILGRLLEKKGYTVGVIPQPDWKDVEAFKVLGKPKLAFLVSAGAMDSMVANYTANKHLLNEACYSLCNLQPLNPLHQHLLKMLTLVFLKL